MAYTAFQTPFLPARLTAPQQTRLCRKPSILRCAAQPPRRIGAVARDLQVALQAALTARISRLAVELPPGARLGTEKRGEDSSRFSGDRELCRILASMFEGTDLSVHALFSSPSLVKAAKKAWGPLVECRIGTWDEIATGRKKGKQAKKSGFGSPEATKSSAPFGEGLDVLLVVAPTAAQLGKVKQFGEQWGMDKLIILLNCDAQLVKAPMHLITYIDDEFEKVYFYRPNPHPNWSGGVLFRKFPDDWVLCRQPPVGFLKEILTQESQPSLEQIKAALEDEGKDPAAGIMNKISSLLGSD